MPLETLGTAPCFRDRAIQYAICRQNANRGRRYWHLSNNEDLRGTEQPSRDVRRRWLERGTGKGLHPRPPSASASSTARRMTPDLAGSGRHRRGQAGRHRNTVAQLGFVHLWLRSRGGGPLSTNRGVAVIAGPLIVEREEMPSVPLDDVTEGQYILPQRRDSQPWVARNAGNRPMLRLLGNPMCNFPPKCQ